MHHLNFYSGLTLIFFWLKCITVSEEADCKAGWTERAVVAPSQGVSQITPTLSIHSTQQPVFPICHAQPHPSGCWREAALIYPTPFCFLASEGRKDSLSYQLIVPALYYFLNYFFLFFFLVTVYFQLLEKEKKCSPQKFRGVGCPFQSGCWASSPFFSLLAGIDCFLVSLP